MAQKAPCVHAYGLEIIRCRECGVQVGSLCRRCGYESRYDEDHLDTCSAAGSAIGQPGAAGRPAVTRTT